MQMNHVALRERGLPTDISRSSAEAAVLVLVMTDFGELLAPRSSEAVRYQITFRRVREDAMLGMKICLGTMTSRRAESERKG